MNWKKIWSQSFSSLRYRAILHILFWPLYFFLWLSESPFRESSWSLPLSILLLGLLRNVFLFYSLVYVIVPFLSKKKYVLGGLTFIVCYFISIVLRDIDIRNIISWHNNKVITVQGSEFFASVKRVSNYSVLITGLLSSITSLFYTIFIPVIINVLRYFYIQNTKKILLENENAKLELAYLKSQVNPHLLFNTLNNVQSYITHDEKNKSLQLLTNLSDFLRFSLYETNEEFIRLSKEIKLVSDYVNLEKARYSNAANIAYAIESEDCDQKIPPLLLMPFIENAFKHGMEKQLTNAWVTIHLKVTCGMLHLQVQNSSTYTMPNQTGGVRWFVIDGHKIPLG